MFIDTHCHISKEDYDDIEKVINEAKDNQVEYLIICGCDKKGIKESIEIANNHDNIFLEIGYHPSEVLTTTDEDLEELKTLAKNNKVVAIGEIGLDYYWNKDNKEKQRDIFRKQLSLAEELNLPVVIHTREAIEETYQILKEYNVKGVMHCFSGSKEMAEKFINLGFLLGIGGVLTFKNSKLYQVVEEIPLNKLVLETDSPYLTPEPHRGETNQSAYIPLIAEKIADIKNISVKEVEEETTKNAISLFDLNINL